ncbi:MAG: ribonuclease VapC [Chloroflexi bacterium]|nr:ribonuclease VapC [Chloroflexota bacterium]
MTSQPDSQRKRVIVLDTSAFVAGFDPFGLGAEQVTVPKVEEEIRRNSMVKMRLETAIESGKLKVKAPTQEFSVKAKASANKVGDSFKLSETDKQLLALALELKASGYAPQIVTDDYSIQNVATQMGIEFLSLATFGIKRLLEWIRYCPACHKQYPADCKFKECQVCGTELKRKPKRQEPKQR